jgi:hypothetical protein
MLQVYDFNIVRGYSVGQAVMAATNAGCPIQAVFWLEWDRSPQCATSRLQRPLSGKQIIPYQRYEFSLPFLFNNKRGKSRSIPLKPKHGLTPISCHAVLERSACAPFIKERRMECINATSLRRKSGQMGHPAFVAGTECGLRLCGGPQQHFAHKRIGRLGHEHSDYLGYVVGLDHPGAILRASGAAKAGVNGTRSYDR